MKASGIKIIADNRKARHYWEFLEKFEAGVALLGSEVKSLRQGKINFKDGYVRLENGQAWLLGVHIAPYENTGRDQQHEPERPRRLLLHAAEIGQLTAKVEQKGLSVVPSKIYFKNGRIKLEIVLARGKNVHDRRDALKERDLDREAARERAAYS